MVFGMTLLEFAGFITALVALIVTIYRARVTPTVEAVELLIEPLTDSLKECSTELEKRDRIIEDLRKDHKKWKALMIAWLGKLSKSLIEMQGQLEREED